jgi:hypothetical protein
MHLPHWYLNLVAWLILACGSIGAICLAVAAAWWCIERTLNYFEMHRLFVKFLVVQMRERNERRKVARVETGAEKRGI